VQADREVLLFASAVRVLSGNYRLPSTVAALLPQDHAQQASYLPRSKERLLHACRNLSMLDAREGSCEHSTKSDGLACRHQSR